MELPQTDTSIEPRLQFQSLLTDFHHELVCMTLVLDVYLVAGA